MNKVLKVVLGSVLVSSSAFCFADNFQNFVAGTSYEVCFTPGGSCTNMIADVINNAQKTINVQAYGFTNQPIISALLNAVHRGVKVQVILDKSNLSGNNSVIPQLQSNNIPFEIDYKVSIAHNKVMIIDNKTVVTGSFNFTNSAQARNAENVLIINSPQLATAYEQNFESREAAAVGYQECLTIKKCSHSKYQGE